MATCRECNEGILGGPVAKQPPANAEDTGSIPAPGRPPVPRGSESPALATEAGAPRARVPEQGQACAPQLERSPWPTAARESPRAAVKTQSSQQ